ncbi:hypothetical protein ABPG72_018314 [Tetrahymena utriculariae]
MHFQMLKNTNIKIGFHFLLNNLINFEQIQINTNKKTIKKAKILSSLNTITNISKKTFRKKQTNILIQQNFPNKQIRIVIQFIQQILKYFIQLKNQQVKTQLQNKQNINVSFIFEFFQNLSLIFV